MSAWQRLKSFSGQNRSTPGTSNRQERGSHDAQPRDSSSKNSQAPPADHLTYRHRMIENVPRQHAAQRAAVRSCCGQGQLCSMPGRGWHAARLVLTWLNRLVRCYWFCCARAMGEWSPPINQQEEIGREATVEAPSAQTRKDYTSRPGALSRFFRMSRDGRKSKYKDLKATVKGDKNRLAHLIRSREQWMIRAERAGEQITTLEVEIAELTTDCCGPGWRRWGGANKIKTPHRTPPRVGPVPGEGFRGQHSHLAFTSLGPGFWRLKIRPRFCSSSARKFSSPSGRPVRSCARRAFNSSSLMALVNRRRQLGAICKSGATCTRRYHALSGEPPRCSSDNGLVPGPIRRARG